MYWDTYSEEYRRQIFYAANFGWFQGDLETNEIFKDA
jgi:hypothetical protein